MGRQLFPNLLIVAGLLGSSLKVNPPPDTIQANIPAEIAAVLSAFDALAEGDLWPGFEPKDVPLALYDGDSTWLVRHPDPPEGFRAVPDDEVAVVFPGRHPSARANTSTELGGVETAVVILEDRLTEPPVQLAGLLLHEAFHVFQRRHHPGWSANEVALLTYPMTDSAALGLRRLETRDLREALMSGSAEKRRAWARSALAVRAERFERMPADAVAYERGTELYEGLARYVERRAVGDVNRPVFDTVAFFPEEVRQRAYVTGQALALLLDDALPAWKERLASDSAASLDGLLAGALSEDRGTSRTARPGATERQRALARAGRDVRALERDRRERLTEFLERPGWQVEFVTAEGAPLWPQRFDPLNLLKVDEDRVMHTRWLVLGNDASRVEITDHTALSTAAGDHPLFEGVSRLLVTGLPGPPVITEDGDAITLEAPSLEAQIRGGSVERSSGKIIVRL